MMIVTIVGSILLLIATRARRVEVVGIAIIFASLALGAMLLRSAIARLAVLGAVVIITICAVAVWFGQGSAR